MYIEYECPLLERMMEVIYFKDVPEVGNLYWNELLFRFEDYDMIFTCKDDNDTLYYCVCDDCLSGNYSWLVVPVTQERIDDVRFSRITVLTPFKEAERILVVDIKGFETDRPECIFNWTKYSDIDLDELPAEDQYFDGKSAAISQKYPVKSVGTDQYFPGENVTPYLL